MNEPQRITTGIKPWHKIIEHIDLPLGTAIWVLAAHALTLLSPLLVIWAVDYYWDYLSQVLYAPALLYYSAVFMITGSAFEIADNTFDRWYLSDAAPSLCDWLFSSCICLALALNIIACLGQYSGLVIAAIIATMAFSVMYLMDWPKESMRGLLGIASVASFYWTVGDPVVLFAFVSTFLTVYFFGLLQKTRAQSLHGFTTIVNAFGVLCTPWAFYNASRDEPMAITLVVTVSLVIVGAALLIKPVLLKLSATPRKV